MREEKWIEAGLRWLCVGGDDASLSMLGSVTAPYGQKLAVPTLLPLPSRRRPPQVAV